MRCICALPCCPHLERANVEAPLLVALQDVDPAVHELFAIQKHCVHHRARIEDEAGQQREACGGRHPIRVSFYGLFSRGAEKSVCLPPIRVNNNNNIIPNQQLDNLYESTTTTTLVPNQRRR